MYIRILDIPHAKWKRIHRNEWLAMPACERALFEIKQAPSSVKQITNLSIGRILYHLTSASAQITLAGNLLDSLPEDVKAKLVKGLHMVDEGHIATYDYAATTARLHLAKESTKDAIQSIRQLNIQQQDKKGNKS